MEYTIDSLPVLEEKSLTTPFLHPLLPTFILAETISNVEKQNLDALNFLSDNTLICFGDKLFCVGAQVVLTEPFEELDAGSRGVIIRFSKDNTPVVYFRRKTVTIPLINGQLPLRLAKFWSCFDDTSSFKIDYCCIDITQMQKLYISTSLRKVKDPNSLFLTRNASVFHLITNLEWKKYLEKYFSKSTYDIRFFSFWLFKEYKTKTIYPPRDLIFNALNITTFDKVKVVIVGQDPYHKKNQAHGLAFSVGNKNISPSLKNIFNELSRNGFKPPLEGDLTFWAEQGVLLLNTVLTVVEAQPNSHQNMGWERITDAIFTILSKKKRNIVFLFWGQAAQKKTYLVDTQRHKILTSVHPSPLAGNKFIGCNCFVDTNDYLQKNMLTPINWGHL